MTEVRDQKFDVASIGKIYRKTLSLFAHHLEDEHGNDLTLAQIEIGQPFFVLYKSGTGLTRTSARRIT